MEPGTRKTLLQKIQLLFCCIYMIYIPPFSMAFRLIRPRWSWCQGKWYVLAGLEFRSWAMALGMKRYETITLAWCCLDVSLYLSFVSIFWNVLLLLLFPLNLDEIVFLFCQFVNDFHSLVSPPQGLRSNPLMTLQRRQLPMGFEIRRRYVWSITFLKQHLSTVWTVWTVSTSINIYQLY